MTAKARTVWIVPHTHWDREWYAAAATYRVRLMDLVDGLLSDLEKDPSYAHFMLDGQMAVVDDYLALRPGEHDRIRQLASSGRLGIGPWFVLADEFLVSGETLVRNLEMGLDAASHFGGAMPVGYLPDMFGHIAQMPQILRGFGFTDAVVWRGVPSSVDRSAFWWRSPDGSQVRAEYLPDGYGNGAATPDDAKELVARIHQFVDHWGDLVDGPVLWMNGTDHELPQPWLGRVVAEANDIQDDFTIVVGPLVDYLALAPTDNLPAHTGELRSGARANLLMGVASNRVDIKQAATAAERWLEQVAEPAAALFSAPAAWPGELLGSAWRQVVLNSAHDSSCACSLDEVCDAVGVRYAEARSLAAGVAERAAADLAARLAGEGTVVTNTTARPRSGVVAVTIPGRHPAPGTQVVAQLGGEQPTDPLVAGDAAEVLRMVLAWDRSLTHVELLGPDTEGVIAAHPRRQGEPLAGGEVLPIANALTRLATDTTERVRVVQDDGARHEALVWTGEVPGFGWRLLEPTPPPQPAAVLDGPDGPTLTNGVVTVRVDTATGLFDLDDITGLGALVDDGDAGDTYNWCPPANNTVVDTPQQVEVRVVERGPLRATVEVVRTYQWPTSADALTRHGTTKVDILTKISVNAGDPLVHLEVSLDNRSRDHRLRLWLPVAEPAAYSEAGCAFASVRRPLVAEGGPTEAALPTWPMRRFVCAGGLTVVTDGLAEYELVEPLDGGMGAVAVTLLRCTGVISQGPMATRPLPAGPPTPTPDAQMPGPRRLRLAVARGDDPTRAFALAEHAFTPWLTSWAPGGGDLGATGSALEVLGAEVSSVRRRHGALEVRVFNPTDAPTTVEVPGRRGWLVDLAGRSLEAFEGRFDLHPWGIATARLVDS